MEVKNHELLEQKMCKEIELIENKYANNSNEMTIQDVEKLDKLYHTLKSMATYNAMKEAESYSSRDNGMSGTRMTYSGRRARDDYSEGYDRGYSEAMNRTMPYYPNRY